MAAKPTRPAQKAVIPGACNGRNLCYMLFSFVVVNTIIGEALQIVVLL